MKTEIIQENDRAELRINNSTIVEIQRRTPSKVLVTAGDDIWVHELPGYCHGTKMDDLHWKEIVKILDATHYK